jgi:type VI secretion system protein ImpK
MNTLTLGRDNRTHMYPAPETSRLAGNGMRDLLHDTALLVTSLSAGGTVRDAASFRERCGQLVDQLTDALSSRNCPEDVKCEALLAQCGLLDEVALRYLPGEGRTAWETHPMQVERFSIHDAGRRVIDNVEARLHESSPDVELLEYYAAILGMGFMGRTVREGDAKRTALIAALDTRLQALRADVDQPFLTETTGLRIPTGLRRLAPWLLVALACIVAIVVWIASNRTVDTQLAQIVPVKTHSEAIQR